jgi:hypothetical protein
MCAITILARCREMTLVSSSKPGSPTGRGARAGQGMGPLHVLLVALGFQASRGIGTILVAPDVPPNHGTVLVACDERHSVVDASILHGEPWRLDTSTPTGVTHPAWGVQCRRRNGPWHLRWRPVHRPDGLDCRLDHLQVTRETFRERHEHTRPWSAFTYAGYARLLCGEAVVGTTGGRRVELTSAGGVVSRRLEGDDRIRLFVDEWGMQEEIVQRFPPDTPTPPPPWSRTARSASEAQRSRGHCFSVQEGVTQ